MTTAPRRPAAPAAPGDSTTSTTGTTGTTGTGGNELRRGLGRRQMALLGLGSALGTGLFLGAGAAISVAGPAVLLSYAAGALIALVVAYALGEMVSALPVRGSFGTIAGRALGPFAGFSVQWIYWVALIVGIGSEVVAAAIYLRFWWPDVPLWAAVLVFAAAVTGVNATGVRNFGTTESVLSAIKAFAVVAFIVIGTVLIVFGLPDRPATGVGNWTAHGGFVPEGPMAIWLVMSIVLFSFAGIELVAVSAPEAKDPGPALRGALRTLVLRLTLFYLGAIAVMLAVLPWTEVSGGHGTEGSPFVTMFDAAGIPAAASVTNFVVLVTALSAANANLYAAGRMLHSLGDDRFAPRALGATTGHGVPRRAILFSALGFLVTAGLTALFGARVFGVLLALGTFGIVAVWIVVLLTLLAFRRDPDRPPSSLRLPGGRVTPVLGIAALLSVYATGIFVPEMRTACLVGVPALLVLVGAYALLVRARAGRPDGPRE
ncbi:MULTISPECIES: amino acid permease [Streptomyces]|nr:amino acid permease [Streptomyces tsukubensis]AZK95413.1 amino acid permease [Streptomyces tsukubensis]EIF91293.1 amino acid permease-associated protein [Streptomyces tsukubensis NRRL18488]